MTTKQKPEVSPDPARTTDDRLLSSVDGVQTRESTVWECIFEGVDAVRKPVAQAIVFCGLSKRVAIA